MKSLPNTIQQDLRKRVTLEPDSLEMVGDLRPSFNGGTGGPKTTTGWTVWSILTGSASAQGTDTWQGGLMDLDNAKCIADTCCVWRHVALEMEKMFRGQSGRCTAEARASVRLGFHDAGTWSKFTEDYGGADGSILLSGLAGNEDELKRGENNGLQNVAKVVIGWYNKYHRYGVGMADLIQMASNVAAVVCPLGPRTRSFVGRVDSSRPALNNLLPNVLSEAAVLIDLFENKTIRVHGLTALVGAHTTSQQHFVDPSRAGDPQDSTPGIWDVEFYAETAGNSSPARVFKFPSDVKLAHDPFSAAEWNQFASQQAHWNEDYAKEYVRLSLLGVNNINDLTECTKVLPPRIDKASVSDDNAVVKQWLSRGGSKKTSDNIESGNKVSKLD
ncbi:heme peroxidase [Clohesyomyces aquaticus]|uniref:Peroxidase n=1 Tax=Clohesyomyces aquaticus TaxID=1231657 RepID=A0A1Y1Z415_9PLEO|nr:heme peroxidase [Clohesyomyces aquaticus]